MLDRELQEELERWEARGLRRRTDDAVTAGRVDFRSSDYLRLAQHADVVAAAQEALERYGAGSRAARLLGGGCPEFEALEGEVASWLGAEAALLYPSGYQANLGLLATLAGPGTALISDAANHASLIDAARLARGRVFVHAHLELTELERKLRAAAGFARRIVVTEAVFSMDGDRAPLPAMHELCARHDAWLVVDEAHAVGVLGPQGAGACADSLTSFERLAARVVTGGKALGVAGALVVGSRALREMMLHRARAFVFTTAPMPATAAALRKAVALARGFDDERATLRANAARLATALDLPEPAAGIIPIPLPSAEATTEAVEALAGAGFDVGGARPPTVPAGGARLRVTCHADDREADLAELAQRVTELRRATAAPASTTTERAPVLFVVGTDTDVGKTLISAALLRALRERGPARYWKPVQTGEDSDTDAVSELAGVPAAEQLRPVWSLPLPASPHTAATQAGVQIRLDSLEQSLVGLRRTLSECHLLVELAGGVLVPYDDEGGTQADWLAHLRPPTVVVARSGLGTLNHTLLTLEALRARHVEPRGLILVGERHPANRETLERMSSVPVVELPLNEGQRLTGDDLDRWLNSVDLDAILEPER